MTICPNCLEELSSSVTTAHTHVVCNGRGEHITSALPMDHDERVSMLSAMDRTTYDHRLGDALLVLEAAETNCLKEFAFAHADADRWKGKSEGIRYAIDTIRALVPMKWEEDR